MPRTQRVAQYIQRLVYEQIYHAEDREERPRDAQAYSPEETPRYAAWSATSFAACVPFRDPADSANH